MTLIGSTDHRTDCTLRAINQAVDMCSVHMDMGLTEIENILDRDRPIMHEILRRHGIAGGME